MAPKHTEDLISWWYKSDMEGLHPEDAGYLHKLGVKRNVSDQIVTQRLCPVPYLGNLRKAKLVIVMLNPSLGSENQLHEDEEHERPNLAVSLRQKGCPDFWPLTIPASNKEGTRPGSRRYWRQIFSSYVRARSSDLSTGEALYGEIARAICCVQLIPYHSRKAPSPVIFYEMPTTRNMVLWIKEEVRAQARPVIIFRGWPYLDESLRLSTNVETHLPFSPQNGFLRKPSFNPESMLSSRAAAFLDKALQP